jgi:hypothetical protein
MLSVYRAAGSGEGGAEVKRGRQPHAALVLAALYWLRAHGWFAFPVQQQARCVGGHYFRGSLYPGIADILAIRSRGGAAYRCQEAVAVECKTGRDTLRPEQRRFERDWTEHGGQFIVCRELKDLEVLE